MKKQFGFTLEEVQPSPQRGEGAFVGGAVQMRVRGSILPLKNFSPFTFHFSQQTFRHAELDSASQDKILKQVQNDVKDGKSVKKVAFTLAEVLITLGIIGVVAAITMPTLIKNYQKHETVNRLKETYSILYQAVRMSETENGLLETWEIPSTTWGSGVNVYNGGKAFFEQYLKPYIKVAKECKYLSNECWADEYTRPNGEISTYFSALSNNAYGMVLANGSVIGFYPRQGTVCQIYVDLNGKKGPNKYGKDAFTIVIAKTSRNDELGNFNKSGVYMYGQGKNRTALTSGQYACSKTATTHSGGYCGALIMHDGWKIEKDYPW